MKYLIVLSVVVTAALASTAAQAECEVYPEGEHFMVSCDGDRYAIANTKEGADKIASRRNARGSSMAPVDQELTPKQLHDLGYIGSGYREAGEDSQERAPFSN